ncbi:ABC-three component system middle component 1 [Enterobacter asburiae]|uniref:ABC-three component system middle component 1 n=1 Tax=Enterobacter asburiae TaxID=61645 RepID=UPI00063C6F66|nr:ABC-three component system middle component 1 [Enterobacter asburiae]KLF90842.1 hypothetical protein YA44_11045 [Enterobacter asburiae]KLP44545.1 hypothetical protein ABF55_11050 [Enterobacter asburiae]
MINIVNNILYSNGYERIDIKKDLYLFCLPQESKREEYFVTIQLQSQSDATAQELLDDKAQSLFEEISNSGQVDRSFEKNCTMIICHEEEKISRKIILSIEEDHYNFKKNVITYTSSELTSLKDYLTSAGIKKITNKVISEIINSNDGRNFLKFKDDHANNNDFYSLILKTALKLPFITYTPQEQKLTNLNEEIQNCLSQYQSSIYRKLMEIDTEWTDENIHMRVANIWENQA